MIRAIILSLTEAKFLAKFLVCIFLEVDIHMCVLFVSVRMCVHSKTLNPGQHFMHLRYPFFRSREVCLMD